MEKRNNKQKKSKPKNSNLELRDETNVAMEKINRHLELRGAVKKRTTSRKKKNDFNTILDFFGDQLTFNEWILIKETLQNYHELKTLAIGMRKTFGMVLDHLDTEKKAKLYRKNSVLYSKFIFSGIVDAISECIEFSKNLQVLNLEGLPLIDKYVESLAKGLSSNSSIKEISLQRSNIQDQGCKIICNTVQYLKNVEKINLSKCELTSVGAEYVANMIKKQQFGHYNECWAKSLRYSHVDPETLLYGLRWITLTGNPKIGDDGIRAIVEVLKDNLWIKVIEMENCGLTDHAAIMISDCLEINNYISDDFKEHHNITLRNTGYQNPFIPDIVSNESTSRNTITNSNQGLEEESANEIDYIDSNRDLVVPLNSPTSSNALEHRKILKLRQVRSEMKYVDPPLKNTKKESKSDHEGDIHVTSIHFETNIGDTHRASNRSGVSSITITNTKSANYKKEKPLNHNISNSEGRNSSPNKNQDNSHFVNLTKFDLDELSIPSTRSLSSDMHSSDSDTLRINENMQYQLVKVRRVRPMPLTPMPKPKEPTSNANILKSPRSLFFGNDY